MMAAPGGRGRSAPGAAAIIAVLLAAAAPAAAQSPTMRERVYEHLSRAQAAAEAGDFAKAQEHLQDVEKAKDLSPYETAQLHTAYGFLEYSRENHAEAVRHYEKALQQEGLPPAMIQLTLYTLAQLRFVVEDYAGAAKGLETWLASAESPGPEPHVLLAQAYYKLERWEDALGSLRNAVRIAESGGRPIQESWYLLMRVLHYELGDWKSVAQVLETLIARFPKREYWIQLAAAYGELEDSGNRLASYDAAYLQGLLDRDADLIVYAQLLVQAGAPYRGAVVLRKAMDDGLVERTERTLRLLSEMWSAAREEERAIETLTAVAELARDGEADARIAQLRLDRREPDLAAQAARRALEKGVEDRGPVRLVLGMAHFQQGRHEEAKAAFRQAMESAESRTAAAEWIAYIEREQERLRQLEASAQP
jgi:tetratricopeptide (TPR) repeat protein